MAKTRNGRSQLAKLASAHRPSPRLQTPRKEDYVEIIYELIREKGFAKPVDIANHLHVTPPTVTGMLDGLRREGLIVHEKYGGIALTARGSAMAETMAPRGDDRGATRIAGQLSPSLRRSRGYSSEGHGRLGTLRRPRDPGAVGQTH